MKPESTEPYRIHPLSIIHHLSSSSTVLISTAITSPITCQHFPTALQAPDLPPQCWQPFRRASRPQDRGRLERGLERWKDMAMTSAISEDVPRRQHKDSEHPRWTSASCLDLSHIESHWVTRKYYINKDMWYHLMHFVLHISQLTKAKALLRRKHQGWGRTNRNLRLEPEHHTMAG